MFDCADRFEQTVFAADNRNLITGSWTWQEQSEPAQTGMISRLTFDTRHHVTGLQYFSHAFLHGGEVLESGPWNFYISGRNLLITSPSKEGINGWPNKDGIYHHKLQCTFTLDRGNKHLVLSGCDLAGSWERDNQ